MIQAEGGPQHIDGRPEARFLDIWEPGGVPWSRCLLWTRMEERQPIFVYSTVWQRLHQAISAETTEERHTSVSSYRSDSSSV